MIMVIPTCALTMKNHVYTYNNSVPQMNTMCQNNMKACERQQKESAQEMGIATHVSGASERR